MYQMLIFLALWHCKSLTLYHYIPLLTNLKYKSFDNTIGKGENAGNQHFLRFQ